MSRNAKARKPSAENWTYRRKREAELKGILVSLIVRVLSADFFTVTKNIATILPLVEILVHLALGIDWYITLGYATLTEAEFFEEREVAFDPFQWYFSVFFFNSCDLAGSERIKKSGVEGERLSELQHVNLSLLELGYVRMYNARVEPAVSWDIQISVTAMVYCTFSHSERPKVFHQYTLEN